MDGDLALTGIRLVTAIKKMLALLLFTTVLGIGITYYALVRAGASRDSGLKQIDAEQVHDAKP